MTNKAFKVFISLLLISSIVFAGETKTESMIPEVEAHYKRFFEKRNSVMVYLENVDVTTDFLFYAKKFTRNEFLEKKKEYKEKGGADEYVYQLIDKQTLFYETTLNTKITEKVKTILQSYESKIDFLNNHPKAAKNACDGCLEYINGMLLLNPQDEYFLDLKNKTELQKREIEKYISSGGYEKKLMNRTSTEMDAVTVGKNQLSDITTQWALSEGLVKLKLGEIAAMALISSQWSMKKNSEGMPAYKYVDVEAALKNSNGTCYKITGQMIKQYNPDGTYAEPQFVYEYKELMNCEK